MGIKDGLDDGTYVDTIIKQTDQISNLIEELLQFSKLERDVLQKEEFPIEPLVRSIIDKHKIELSRKKYSCRRTVIILKIRSFMRI